MLVLGGCGWVWVGVGDVGGVVGASAGLERKFVC